MISIARTPIAYGFGRPAPPIQGGGAQTRLAFASNRLRTARVIDAATVKGYCSNLFLGVAQRTLRNVRICVSNRYLASNPGNVKPVEGAGLYFGGDYHPVSFSGQQGVTLADGGYAWSDLNSGITIPAGTPIFLREAGLYTSTGHNRVGGYGIATQLGEGVIGGAGSMAAHLSDATLSGFQGDFTETLQDHVPGPIWVIGETTDGKVSAMIVNDSIGYGWSEHPLFADAQANVGWVARSFETLNKTCGITTFPGQSMVSLPNSTYWQELMALPSLPFQDIIFQLGCNDVFGNQVASEPGGAGAAMTLAVLQTRRENLRAIIAAAFPGVPIWIITPTLRTTATNGRWTNTTQASINTPMWNSYVTDLLSGTPSGYAGVLDIGTALSTTPSDTSTIKFPPFASTLASAAAIGDTVVSLNHSPRIGEALVFERNLTNREDGGTAFGGMGVKSVSGAGPYSVELLRPLVKNHASGSVVNAQYVEGIHMFTYGILDTVLPVALTQIQTKIYA